MKRAFIIALACVIIAPAPALAQGRRRGARPGGASKSATDIYAAEVKAGRDRVAAQIKALTRFLYLLGGVTKGIESADQVTRSNGGGSVVIEQNERNKASVRESIASVREGLNKLDTDFRFNPALRSYSSYVSPVARLGEAAEKQAAAGRFDEAAKSLLEAVGRLADALAAIR